MSSSRPVAVCVLLAAAVHAAVLGWGVAFPPGLPGSATAHGGPLQARMMQEAPPPAPPVADAPASPLPPRESADDAAPTAQALPQVGTAADARPPRVTEIPAEVGMPDAPLPADGVQVRAFLRLDETGRPTDITLATWPADAARAFADQFRRALDSSRFEPGPRAARHCLQMDFEAGDGQPRWSWLPDGQADASRCLGSRAGVPRALPRP